MASGDLLVAFLPGENDYPNSNSATIGRDVDYGYYLEHGDSSDDTAIFQALLPTVYGGGGITLEAVFLMASATSGSVVLGAAFQRLADGVDLSGTVSWDENTTTQAVPGSAETVEQATITFTDGADMASVAAGEPFRLRFRRVGSDGSDDASGNMRLLALRVKET
jgi:hypothetical protein